jgi:hypothetical protein
MDACSIDWSLVIQAVNAAVAAAVGLVVWSYTRETKRLRESSEEQTRLSQRQVHLFAAQMEASIRPFVLCEVTEYAAGGSAFLEGRLISHVKTICRGTLWNPTDRVAHDLRVLVWVHKRGYLWSGSAPILRKPGETAEWLADGPVDRGIVAATYGEAQTRLAMSMVDQHNTRDSIVLFFRDVNANVYANFSLIDNLAAGDLGLRLTQIVYPQ